MVKVIITNAFISKGFENNPALKFSDNGDSVRFRIGVSIYTVYNVAKKEAKQNIFLPQSTKRKRLLKKPKKLSVKIKCMPMLWQKPKAERYQKSVVNCKNKL